MDIISSVLINFNSLYKHTLMKKNFEYLYQGYSIQIVMQEKKNLWKKHAWSYKIGEFVASRTFCSINVIVWWNLLKKIRERLLMKNICKINIIFLTNFSTLRILSLIFEKASQEVYLLLLQLSLWLSYIE